MSSVRAPGRRRGAVLPTLVIVAVLVVAVRPVHERVDRAAVVPLVRLRLRLQHGAADPGRAVRRLRPGHGRPGRRQRRARVPAAPALPAAGPDQPAAGALPRDRRDPLHLGDDRDRRRRRAVRRRRGQRADADLPRLDQAHRLRRDRPPVRAGRLVLRLLLPVVALRPVVRLHRAGRQRHRRRRHALRDGGRAVQRPAPRRHDARPRPTCRSSSASPCSCAAPATGSTSTGWRSRRPPSCSPASRTPPTTRPRTPSSSWPSPPASWRCCSSPTRSCSAGSSRPPGSCC